jgi:hypothetical protein
MMPNLRYNKKLSKILNSLKANEKIPGLAFSQLTWHTENSEKIFINEYNTLFSSNRFIITYYEERGRLFHVNKSGICSVYLIEDMEDFLSKCSFYIRTPKENLYHLLRNSSILPLNGIVRSDKNGIQIYNHKN